LIIADLETGRVLEANPAACAMHGYEYPLFIGQLPQAFIHPHSQDVFVKFLQDSNSSGPLDARLMHIRRDGSIFQAEWHATAFSYQYRLCLLGMVRDVRNGQSAGCHAGTPAGTRACAAAWDDQLHPRGTLQSDRLDPGQPGGAH
jgi:PAS domain S-box-containing protein